MFVDRSRHQIDGEKIQCIVHDSGRPCCPDLIEWHWKDEAKFTCLVQRGLISVDRAAMLRALGEHVVRTRYDDDSLLQVGWDRWQPPSHWQVPLLLPNWGTIEPCRRWLRHLKNERAC